ncbi:hypothetical protein EUTSA_v10027260mg [Eutrema salsugineum]|uniref:Defensin-like protein n=1 Tax=Eutrema salsugineum TaxID=72664 RepID=V4P441_EUTSA|nr:defensin-like protein 171 [Eutrema salsugineum]ESQ54221.1 hypothetical protein EUTSA_v10027260mg [Eutrema salsugineum]
MAKITSSLVLPIIFLVILALAEQNMGCMAILGSCAIFTDCSGSCKVQFGPNTRGYCDRSGGAGTCLCVYICPTNETHM